MFNSLLKSSLFALSLALLFNACSNADSPKENKTVTTGIEKAEKLFVLKSPEETGISFRNDINETADLNYLRFLYAYNGGGVSIGDVNNDDLLDIFLTSNMGESKLYLNQGELKFKDITGTSGIVQNGSWATGSTMVDINNDGLLDIYICYSGLESYDKKNRLYINNGDLKFVEQSEQYGLDIDAHSTQASFFDYDLDGDLDVYIVNHLSKFPQRYADQSTRKQSKDLKDSDRLLENNGQGKFIDVTLKSGIANKAFGLNVSVSDFNQDGYPDMYVTSDFREDDYLYINQRNGSFKNKIKELTGHTSQYSMGSDVGDINNDGKPDLIVVDMSAEDNFRHKMMMGAMAENDFQKAISEGYHHQYMYNTLQLNRGDAYFSEIAMMSGVAMTDWSWCPLFADFDGDQLQDIYITNGIKRDVLDNDYRFRITQKTNQRPGDVVNINVFEALDTYLSTPVSNYMFKNKGKFSFDKSMESWGLSQKTFSNGAMYGDLDNDGDLDLVVNNVDEYAFLYENKLTNSNQTNYIAVSLEGPPKNTDAVGATISVISDQAKQFKEIYPSRAYLSSYNGPQYYYLSPRDSVVTVQIAWPSGETSETEVSAGKEVKIKYNELAKASLVETKPLKTFNRVSSILNHQHSERAFDDISRESLIPHKLSSNGPFVTVGDLNGDNLEDVFISGSAGFSAQLYIQNKNGQLVSKSMTSFSADKSYEDGKAIFIDIEGDGDLDIYVPSTSNEFDAASELYQDRIYENDGRANFKRSAGLSNNLTPTSTVTMMDFDQDGDLDLFVGASSVPGKYGLSPRSTILQNNGGSFIDITNQVCKSCAELGMVRSSEWFELESNKQNILLVAGEWTGLKALQFQNGAFTDIGSQLGIDNYNGWWFSSSKLDLDNDGDQDLILGNLGHNYKFNASQQEPLKAYIHDFDKNGQNDIILSYYQYGVEYPVRGRNCTMQQIPGIQRQFPNYSSFANADIKTVYGEQLSQARQLNANTFSSVALINSSAGLSIKALPVSAQFSAIKSICSKDINEDGKIDLVIAGNHYYSEAETPRADASYGLVLYGNGKGGFRTVGHSKSGLLLKGETQSLEFINLKDKVCLLAGINKESVQAYSLD